MGVGRKLLGQLRRRFGEVAASVQRFMPAVEIGFLDEAQSLGIVRDLADEEAVGIPAVKDIADVEDDGRNARAQPWRALKRRFVLLMT